MSKPASESDTLKQCMCTAMHTNSTLFCATHAKLYLKLTHSYTFFSNSLVNHNKFIEIQKELGLRPSELVQLSTTRWACQVRSVNAVLNNLSAILACLSNMNTSMALGIRSKLCKTKTLYMLVMFSKLLGITEGLHRYLQGLDLSKAVQYKTAVLKTLTELRTDSGGEDVFRRAMALCEANDIQLPVCPRQKQKRYDGFVVESACGSTSNLTTSDEFRQQLFLSMPGQDGRVTHPPVFRAGRSTYVRYSCLQPNHRDLSL